MNVRPAGWMALGMLAAFGMTASLVTLLGGRVFADDATVLYNGDIIVRLQARATAVARATADASAGVSPVDDAIKLLTERNEVLRNGLIKALESHADPATAVNPARSNLRSENSEPTAAPTLTRVPTRLATIASTPTAIERTALPVSSATAAPVPTREPDHPPQSDGPKAAQPTRSIRPTEENRGPAATNTPKPTEENRGPSPSNTPRPVATDDRGPAPTNTPRPQPTAVPTQVPVPTTLPTQIPQPTATRTNEGPSPSNTPRPERTRVPEPTEAPQERDKPTATRTPKP